MNVLSRFFVITMLVCSVMLMHGCKAKHVSPYSPTGNNMPEGSGVDGGFKEGNITEEMLPSQENLPAEEGLDATGNNSNAASFNADQQSDAYKREHGRSSPEMKPIYFDFDQNGIRSDQLPSMEHNAGYLRDNPSVTVTVEGNTDDRGTNEYNLALAERRAQAAKTYLIEFGIEESRIRTVSWGEERPLFTGQSEEDYAMNRRDDFILE